MKGTLVILKVSVMLIFFTTFYIDLEDIHVTSDRLNIVYAIH